MPVARSRLRASLLAGRKHAQNVERNCVVVGTVFPMTFGWRNSVEIAALSRFWRKNEAIFVSSLRFQAGLGMVRLRLKRGLTLRGQL